MAGKPKSAVILYCVILCMHVFLVDQRHMAGKPRSEGNWYHVCGMLY